MEKEIGGYLDWVDSPVLEEDDTDFSTTFSKYSEGSGLEVMRLCDQSDLQNDHSKDLSQYWHQKFYLKKEVNQLAGLSDPCQIIYIRQRNSYSRLQITHELFRELLYTFSIFSHIWDFVLPFSFKTHESDIGHAPYRFRHFGSLSSPNTKLGSFECAYGFRYVKLNGRASMMKDNPDYDPWSVRQTAVYQQFNSTQQKIVFVLIAPSDDARTNVQQEILQSSGTQNRLNPFQIHLTLVATLHKNWRLYIRSLEHSLTKQSNRITLAQVQSGTERLSPLTDFTVNFVDRQRLKMTEDKILDLVIIFESLYNTLSKLHLQCRNHCMGENCADCICAATLEEFEDQIYDVQLNMKKVDVLYKRAQSTAILLSDLLEYENAHIGHLNERSLNGLVAETKDENAKMMILTERSTQDAAAVKILTVITLIYLPMTVVASFFSSQLIQVNENGQVSVVSGAWWFVVVSVPLTVATIFVWRYWLSHSMRKYGLRASDKLPIASTEERNTSQSLRPSFILMKSPVKSVIRLVSNMRNQGRKRTAESCHAA